MSDQTAMQEAPDPQAVIESILSVPNLASEMSDAALTEIAQDVLRDYKADKSSMSDWLDKMGKAIDLACLVKSDKSYPFDKASNVKYPLVASAALQFNARAYPAIVPSDGVVKCKTWGRDQNGKKAARGDRVASYMSWQLSCEVEEWEAETDKLLVQLPIVGDMFRKVWFDGERARCRLVEPGKMIVNGKCQSIQMSPRCSEEFELYPYQIKEREGSGRFIEIDYEGRDDDKQAIEEFVEQHTRLDLDEDGYPEPYIVTIHPETEKVVSIAPDFEISDVDFEMEARPVPVMNIGPMGPVPGVEVQNFPVRVKKIERRSYFIHYQFMPGMGGGFWGTGLGILLGDISAAINTSFNMLIDAGHYASLGGGFIGSEFRLKGGAQRMKPGEWVKTQASGNDVRSSIVPMTFPGPSETMFSMLGMLIDAGKEVASTQDILTGDTGGKTQTATTTMALIEQGLKVFTAAYKRIFRSLKREYRIFADINAGTVDPEKYNLFLDDGAEDEQGNVQQIMHDPAADFAAMDMDIQPVADPNSVTRMQEMAKAQLLNELADAGRVDPAESTRRVLQAASIDDSDALLPQPNPMQEKMQMMQMRAAEADLVNKMANIELTLAKVEEARANAMSDLAGIDLDNRKMEFDKTIAFLKESRDELASSIAGANSGMAGQPGY